MKLSPKRYETLLKASKNKRLMWNDGGWGEPVRWWVEGNEHEKLNDAVCFWLVRNKLVVYDEEFNDAQNRGIHDDSPNRLGIFAFAITDAGLAALKVNGPSAKVLPFRRREVAA